MEFVHKDHNDLRHTVQSVNACRIKILDPNVGQIN
jgi:hypothetical protein